MYWATKVATTGLARVVGLPSRRLPRLGALWNIALRCALTLATVRIETVRQRRIWSFPP